MLNKRWGGIAGVLLLSIMVLAGCADDDATGGTRTGRAVPAQTEFKGLQGPFPDRGFYVIRRPEAWTALWAGRTAPAVDFTTQSVIVALMGQQPTTGYSIAIDDVRATAQQVVAYVTEDHPTNPKAVAALPTYPYDMVVTPKLEQTVSVALTGAAVPPVVIQDAYRGTQSQSATPQTLVMRSPAAWNEFWTNTVGDNTAIPPVDFSRYTAVAVMAGRKSSAGYVVQIASVETGDDRLTVHYRIRTPPPDAPVAMVPTSPYEVALIPITPQPIAFLPISSPPVVVAAGQ